MPNRIIKESINESKGLSECSLIALDLYKRLITYADDYGRFNADTTIMLARLYPRELDSVTQEDIVNAIVELVGTEKIAFYTSSARRDVFGCFPNWDEHQRVRQSRKKFPDPDDTTVNDWYCQRFIPVEMKIAIIDRDNYKCCECGKYISTERDARRLVKQGSGMYHIDHIVPVNQGGRATMENLRLTCPTCNRTRKRQYNFSEIAAFAANGGELPQDAATICRNPIQSESVSESNPNPSEGAAAPAPTRAKHGQFGWVRLTGEEYGRLTADLGEKELARCITYIDESAQLTGNKNKWKDWNLVVRNCSRDKWGVEGSGYSKKKVGFQAYEQGDEEPEYNSNWLLEEARKA